MTVVIDGTLEIPPFLSTGRNQQCPFSNGFFNSCGKGSSNLTLINGSKKLENVTELHGHLIRDHHFFQGDVLHRIPPEDLIEVLGIQPETDYELQTKSLQVWRLTCSCSHAATADLKAARKEAEESYFPEDGSFEAFILPHKNLGNWNLGKSKKGRFLHIFANQILYNIEPFELGGAAFEGMHLTRNIYKGHSIFNIREVYVPVLGDGDKIYVD